MASEEVSVQRGVNEDDVERGWINVVKPAQVGEDTRRI